jgi:hypothetical protein
VHDHHKERGGDFADRLEILQHVERQLAVDPRRDRERVGGLQQRVAVRRCLRDHICGNVAASADAVVHHQRLAEFDRQRVGGDTRRHVDRSAGGETDQHADLAIGVVGLCMRRGRDAHSRGTQAENSRDGRAARVAQDH